MTRYQFQSYLNNIGEMENDEVRDKPSETQSTSTEELIKMAENKGLKIPKKY